MYFTQLTSTALTFFAFVESCRGSSILARDALYDTDAALALGALRRGLPNAPNGYTPQAGDCPSNRPVIRSASSLSPNETSWLNTRRNNTVGAMRDLLGRLNISNFDAQTYINNIAKNASALPNIGVAMSGGGYRALMNGAGALAAFDSRTNNSTSSGHLGGLLQATTYLAGLSGGSWLVGSLFTNNFTTVPALLEDNTSTVWEFGNSIFTGPAKNGIQTLSTLEYFNHIYDAVQSKADAGFNTSITDYWGRALSYQLINATDGGPAYTWSSIALQSDFTNGDWPMPIVVADGRAPGEKVISANATVYEFNPWEFGTWDPTTYGFVPSEYLGSNFTGGVLPNNERCVRGFDNAGYVMGTSSSLFNQFLLQLNGTSVPTLLKNVLAKVLAQVDQANNDIATFTPNPFYHYHNETSLNAQSESLFLVDGGEDLQNIPLHPLIQPYRAVDVIFAVDSSADTDSSWPNGTALVATYERSRNTSGIENGTAFPHVPDQNTFVNLGLNTRPTFFGCDAANLSGPAPLVVYIPNSPYVYNSNVSTFDPSYNNTERNAIVQNGYNVATMANATVDPLWPSCVGCAVLSRSLDRTRTPVPDVCRQCFQKYCWDGTRNSTVPAPYQPRIALTPANVRSGAGRMESTGALGLMMGMFWIISVLVS